MVLSHHYRRQHQAVVKDPANYSNGFLFPFAHPSPLPTFSYIPRQRNAITLY